jgi:DNA replicative helicase MCM subunit Mcm2 (Cdc46/Mcm family)
MTVDDEAASSGDFDDVKNGRSLPVSDTAETATQANQGLDGRSESSIQDVPEDLEKCGYTGYHALQSGIVAIFYRKMPLLVDYARKDWPEKFEKRAKALGVGNQDIQQGLIFLSSIYIKREEGNRAKMEQAASAGGVALGSGSTASIQKSLIPCEIAALPVPRNLNSPINVKEAMRGHSGRVLTAGMVTSTSDVYKIIKKARWRCRTCGRYLQKHVTKLLDPPNTPRECPYCESKEGFEHMHEYLNAITIYLQDEEDANSVETLPVILLERDTWDNPVGEIARIIGDIEQVRDQKRKTFHTHVIAKAIRLQQKKKNVLTYPDIRAIKAFAGVAPTSAGKDSPTITALRQTLRSRLISMFAPNIICDNDTKLLQLLVALGAPEDEYHRGRINELMVGPPGVGKTKLAKETMKLRSNSRFVSSKNTTGLSLTAMILKEDDTYVVHLGPVPLSKNAICVVNELDKLEPEKQDNLLDVMEEGVIVLNKFARLKSISAQTTIVATANPRNNRWANPKEISLDEIPIERTQLSRFDLILIFEDSKDIEVNRRYADEKTSYDRKRIKHNYNYLQKYIEFARTLNPAITPEAQSMLNEYWARLAAKDQLFVTRRLLDTLGRLAKALARLELSEVADITIAKKVIELVNKTMTKFFAAIYNIADPRSLAYDETIKIIHALNGKEIDLIEAIRLACNTNIQARYYIGRNLSQSENSKVRALCNKIVENASISRVKIKPLTVRWMSGPVKNDDLEDGNLPDDREPDSYESHISHEKTGESNNGNESGIQVKNEEYDVSDTYDSTNNDVYPSENEDEDKHRQQIFWQVFKELEQLSAEGLVEHETLRRHLVSYGAFDAGNTTQIILEMLKADRLEKVDFGLYRRNSENRSEQK